MATKKHSNYTHSSQKTEIATSASEQRLRWAPCRKRTGEAVPRAERYDMTTSMQQITRSSMKAVNPETIIDVLSWYKILPLNGCNLFQCKTKTSQETERCMRKFLEPSEKPNVMYIDHFFGKACEDLSWNHCTSTLHRSETNGIAERAVRRIKEGTSAVLLQSRSG